MGFAYVLWQSNTLQAARAANDETPPTVHAVARVERADLRIDTLGLHLAEAKHLLQQVQDVVIAEPARQALAEQAACPACGRARRHKDATTIVLRTLFGTVHLRSPRWWHCPCAPRPTQTFSSLAAVLPERNTPELLYLESKFAGLVSYGLSASKLAETLPLGRPLHATAVRLHAQATVEKLEQGLGPEQSMFIDGCQADWEELPRPDLPLTVGLDGGYVHSSQQRSRRDGWFEVIAGKSMPTLAQGTRVFGLRQARYRGFPKTELQHVLIAISMNLVRLVAWFTDPTHSQTQISRFVALAPAA